MDELPADVRDALNEHYGRGNWTASSRAEGDALVLAIELPRRGASWSVVKPWTSARVQNAWRTFASNLCEVRP